MAWQRKIPFGYRVENGAAVPRADEAKAIRLIFEHFLKGDSYLVIAGMMSKSGVRYHAAAQEWNKHMVKRILENGKYTGGGGWPEIVTRDVFDGAARLRASKTDGRRGHPACNNAVKRKLVCAACGSPFRIQTCSRDGIRWWHCGNDGCGAMLKIDDAGLEKRITALLNRLIAQPEALEIPYTAVPLSLEAERLRNELYRELGKADWSEDYAKTLALAYTAERYAALGDGDSLKQRSADLRERLSGMEPLTAFDGGLFNDAVGAVIAGADGSLALRLIGGAVINESGEVRHDTGTAHTA